MSGVELSRRRLLQIGGGAFAVSLASACAPTAPSASPTRPAAAQTPTGARGVLPTYVPSTSGPKPDVPASGPGYDDGFNKFPTNPVKAMPGDPPGTGSTVRSMSIALFPPPTPLAQNPTWQAGNKGLNADFQIGRASCRGRAESS